MVGLGPLAKCYSELITFPTLEERVRYLQLRGFDPSYKIFGENRWMNQRLYNSPEWRSLRREIILRDNGNELAVEGRPIEGKIVVHHINPLRIEDFEHQTEKIFSPENLISMSFDMHNFIHYGIGTYKASRPDYVPRYKNDTIPWR